MSKIGNCPAGSGKGFATNPDDSSRGVSQDALQQSGRSSHLNVIYAIYQQLGRAGDADDLAIMLRVSGSPDKPGCGRLGAALGPYQFSKSTLMHPSTNNDPRESHEEKTSENSKLGSAFEDEKAPEDQFMSGAKLHILIFGLGLAVFIMALDMSILTTAIPIITEKFQSTADIGWYFGGYLLTACSLQPLSGKLYANFSLKWTFLSFFLIFELGSVLSGAATSSTMLIVGRAIAGVGAAGLMSGTLSIVAVVVSLRMRALYTGILSSLFGISTIAGPLLGGAFTQHVSWRWIFYINLPIGGVTIGALMFFFNPPTRVVETDAVVDRIKRLDIIGSLLFIPAVIMILMGLQWGGVTYAWSSSVIIGLFVGAGVILIIFAFWQWHAGDMAMIPPSILLQRTVLWASIAAMFAMGAQVILSLWLPEWFQAVKGDTPVQSGVKLLPAMLAQVVSSILSGVLITKLGYFNPWLLAGTALMSIGSGLISSFEPNTGSSYWIGYQVIYGFGAGMFLTAPIVAVQAVLSAAQTPVGISTVTFFQMFGGALFSGISQTIFNEQLVKELVKNIPGVNIGKLLAAGTAGVHKVVSPEELVGVVRSYNTAILDTFYLGAAVTAIAFFCAFGLEWVSVKGKNLLASEAV
ncbi:MFS general substrate transporter [Amniculicola lignicola CBS 123094]|uniref:MFS general substrate transporter n=1 Tax=Amniculicola lignicola CBS 123094 TaxID=1392246 RepID=A0A6A5X5H1_9PLEO|nr:MFS general substrate transporter [Amniculicola lignicola CBS 123094]